MAICYNMKTCAMEEELIDENEDIEQ